MTPFKISHVKEQGVNVIIAPLAPSFGALDAAARQEIIDLLQAAAVAAELRGLVVPLWRENKTVQFVAPAEWVPFFKTLKWVIVMRNLNRELSCPEADARGVNPHLTGTEGLGIFEKLGLLVFNTARDMMQSIAGGSGKR